MAKKKEEQEVAAVVPSMNAKAFSIIESGIEWHLIEIPFNKESLVAGEPKVIYRNDSMLVVEEQLRIKLVTDIFL